MKTWSRVTLCALGLCLLSGVLSAADGKLMHCFYFTAAKGATDADWQAFYKASDALPGKIPGLTRVWYGKLRNPLVVLGTDAETRKKLAAGEEKVSGPVTRIVREYGACMEMSGPETLKAYADSPAHKEWEEAYFKVRQPGTNTLDIIAP